MSKKSNSGTAFLALIVGGGAIAALALSGSKPGPTPPTPSAEPVSKRMGRELKARAIADSFPAGGPATWLNENTTQKSWVVDPATDLNGNIQTNTIVFDDDSRMSLLVDRYNKLAYRASDRAGTLLEDWTQEGFATSTNPLPVVVLAAEQAGTDLKTGHRAADWIDTHYTNSIANKAMGTRIGRGANYATADYSFRDGSSLYLEVVSESGTTAAIGRYSFVAKDTRSSEIMVFTESGFIPYVSPNLQSSLLYVQIYNVINAYNQMPSSARNIVGTWLTTMGQAGATTVEQNINGVSYKGHQYDITVYTSIVPSEQAIAADLYYDRNSTVSAMNFYILLRFVGDTTSAIKINDTFPDDTIPYDRTKTTAWGPIGHMSGLYMNSDTSLLTSDEIVSKWGEHCKNVGGLNMGTIAGNEYQFPDGSSARITAWTECARQFRILMSYTDSLGRIRDTNYPAFITDYWHVSPSPAPLYGRGVNAHDWLCSYIRAYDRIQRGTPPSGQAHPTAGWPSRQIITMSNLPYYVDQYGKNVLNQYNRLYADTSKWVMFDHGSGNNFSGVSSYNLYFLRYRDDTYAYMAFIKYYIYGDSTGQNFEIQILTTVARRFNSYGIESKGVEDYWNDIRAARLIPTFFYTSPGFQN